MLSFLITLFIVGFAQVPPQDECQTVGQHEPAECPNHIGPPCPPCIVNSASDYKTGDSLVIDSQTRTLINKYMMEYVNYWPANWPPEVGTQGGESIVQGSAGRSLLFLRMYNYTMNSTYLTLASDYINIAIKQMKYSADHDPSYFAGNTGVYILAAQIAKIQNNKNDMDTYLNDLKLIFQDMQNGINTDSSTSPVYKFDMNDGCIMTGIAGLLYSGMIINEYFGANTLNNEYIVNISHYLIDLGLKTAKKYNKNYLIYKFNYEADCYLPGSAEGSGGVVKMLLEAYNRGYVSDLMINTEYKTAIENTLNWFIDIQLSDGNMPTYSDDVSKTCGSVYGTDNDARVQWCHGAPGFIDTLSLAAVVFDGIGENTLAQSYLNHSLAAFNSTWERGLLIKGLMQCHGIGGNTNTLLHIHKNLKIISERNTILNNQFDIQFLMDQSLWRAIQFVKFTLNDANLNALRTKYSNEDYSVWLGSYGMPVIYIDAIQPGWPGAEPVCMPAWDFCGF